MDLAEHWDYIVETAIARLRGNQTPYHVDLGLEAEVRGAAAEFAARLHYAQPLELHTGFDGGADMIIAGKRVDVKSAKLFRSIYRNFYLQIPALKKLTADIYMLVAVHQEEKLGAVIGWVTAEAVARAPINSTRAIPCREIAVKDLEMPWHLNVEEAYLRWEAGGKYAKQEIQV